MLVNLILALATSFVASGITLFLGIYSNMIIVIIVAVILLLLNILIGVTLLKNFNLWKRIEAEGTDFFKEEIEAKKAPNKDMDSKDVEYMDDFLQEVIELGYKKKLYLMITPTREGLSLIHQNPGTTDTFRLIDCMVIPSGKKDSGAWKSCLANIEDTLDTFIKENKDKLVLEDMKIDVEA